MKDTAQTIESRKNGLNQTKKATVVWCRQQRMID
jgi:hypothetical protein